MLIRNVLNLEVNKLDKADMMMTFDVKGSIQGWQTSSDPKMILNLPRFYNNTIKDKVLKDLDFFNSLKWLNITNL